MLWSSPDRVGFFLNACTESEMGAVVLYWGLCSAHLCALKRRFVVRDWGCRVCRCVSGPWLRNICWRSPACVQREEREVRGLNGAALRWKPAGWCRPALSIGPSLSRGFCSVKPHDYYQLASAHHDCCRSSACKTWKTEPLQNRAKLFNAAWLRQNNCKIALIN